MSEFAPTSEMTETPDLSVTEITQDSAGAHEHTHDHEHVHDCPAERIVTPGDIFEFTPEEESIIIVGTQTKKVTRISGLEDMTQLKVGQQLIITDYNC